MPARAKKRIRKSSRVVRNKRPVFKLGMVLFVLLLSVIFFRISGKVWKNDRKTSLVINQEEGDVLVAIFDPYLKEITTISIPAETQVEVAQQKGKWRLKSVWKLSENEGLKGELLAETITKYFKFPVIAWADESAVAVVDMKLLEIIKFLFSPIETNLSFFDRLKLTIFSLNVDNTNRVYIDLSKTNYIKSKILVDGNQGFVKSGTIPSNIAIIFQDPEISDNSVKVIIKDASKRIGFAEEIGELVEALGAKVIAVKKEDKPGIDCEVSSLNKKYREVFSQALYCKNISSTTERDADVEILIGENYFKRY
jgi:hypothetical protein